MKRLLVLFAAVSLVLAPPLLHFAVADQRGEVTICHATINIQRPNGIVFFVGHILRLPPESIEGHEGHGDVVIESGMDDLFTMNGRCCAFSVLPNGDIIPGQVD